MFGISESLEANAIVEWTENISNIRIERGNTFLFASGKKVHVMQGDSSFQLRNKFSEGFVDTHPSRGVRVSGHFLYFLPMIFSSQLVRVNMQYKKLEEKEIQLDTNKSTFEDFLVDENQTITYLTSQGELRQENPDNSSIPKTCVNLKTDSTTGGRWTTVGRYCSYFISACLMSKNSKRNVYVLSEQRGFESKDHVYLSEAETKISHNEPGRMNLTVSLLGEDHSNHYGHDTSHSRCSNLHLRRCSEFPQRQNTVHKGYEAL